MMHRIPNRSCSLLIMKILVVADRSRCLRWRHSPHMLSYKYKSAVLVQYMYFVPKLVVGSVTVSRLRYYGPVSPDAGLPSPPHCGFGACLSSRHSSLRRASHIRMQLYQPYLYCRHQLLKLHLFLCCTGMSLLQHHAPFFQLSAPPKAKATPTSYGHPVGSVYLVCSVSLSCHLIYPAL